MIFFDFEGVSISPQARPILERVVSDWRSGLIGDLVVEGHSDTAHRADQSMDISRQRAWATHDFFVEAGIPSQSIRVRYFGEESPLVATSDEVREPQNRRVEISVRPRGEETSR